MFTIPLTRTNVYVRMNLERGEKKMEKFIRQYGLLILLYLVIIGGIVLLNERMRFLNENALQNVEIAK